MGWWWDGISRESSTNIEPISWQWLMVGDLELVPIGKDKHIPRDIRVMCSTMKVNLFEPCLWWISVRCHMQILPNKVPFGPPWLFVVKPYAWATTFSPRRVRLVFSYDYCTTTYYVYGVWIAQQDQPPPLFQLLPPSPTPTSTSPAHHTNHAKLAWGQINISRNNILLLSIRFGGHREERKYGH